MGARRCDRSLGAYGRGWVCGRFASYRAKNCALRVRRALEFANTCCAEDGMVLRLERLGKSGKVLGWRKGGCALRVFAARMGKCETAFDPPGPPSGKTSPDIV